MFYLQTVELVDDDDDAVDDVDDVYGVLELLLEEEA